MDEVVCRGGELGWIAHVVRQWRQVAEHSNVERGEEEERERKERDRGNGHVGERKRKEPTQICCPK